MNNQKLKSKTAYSEQRSGKGLSVQRLVSCRRCGSRPELEFKNWGRGWGKVDSLKVRILHFCEGVTIELSASDNNNDHDEFLRPVVETWNSMNSANSLLD